MRVKYRDGNRLVYADTSRADSRFWSEHWGPISPEVYRQAANGHLLRGLRRPFATYLPRKGRILEAGCGNGHVVLALRTLGYDVEGIEWASEVVMQVNRVRPDLPVRSGDVTALDIPDNTYRAVVSLGVAEHRREGPEPFIIEAFRILEVGGLLLISVPYFHVLRRLRYRTTGEAFHSETQFFQYAFLPEEFAAILSRHGFVVLERCGYEFWFSLCEDFPFVRSLERIPVLGPHVQGLLDRSTLLSDVAGHMVIFVAQRTE